MSFLFTLLFHLGALGPAEAPFDNPETLDDTMGMRLRPGVPNLFFWPQAVPVLLFSSQVLFQPLYFTF